MRVLCRLFAGPAVVRQAGRLLALGIPRSASGRRELFPQATCILFVEQSLVSRKQCTGGRWVFF